MLVDTVVKRDLQLACQNVKDGQPIGSWNFRDDNAIRVEIHQSGEFKAHQSCVSQVRLGVRVNCTCCCWRNTHSKRTKLMESDQSMKLGGGLSMADDVDSFNRFDWLQWLGWLFELQSDRRSTYHGLAASFLPCPTTSSFVFQEDDCKYLTIATPLFQPLRLAKPSLSPSRRFQTDARNR